MRLLHYNEEHGDAPVVPAPRPVGRADRVAGAFERVRTLLHGEQPERIFEVLDAVEPDLRGADYSQVAALRGAGLIALGRLDDAIAVLEPVAARNGPHSGEAACALADADLLGGNLAAAESRLSVFLDGDASIDPHLAAKGLALYGRLERARGRRTIAARYFLEALDKLEGADEPDAVLHSRLLHDTARAAVETLDMRLFARVREQAATVHGSGRSYAALQRARVLAELVCGELDRAWTIAFAAMGTAPRGTAYVGALYALASVSQAAGDGFNARQLAREAADAAQDVDWDHADPWNRRALLGLVEALAPTDTKRAASLLAHYHAMPPLMPLDGEDAKAAMARAAIFAATGRSDLQLAALDDALRAARDSGDHYDEVSAQIALAALTGEEQYLQRAGQLTRLVPRSWLRRRFEGLARVSITRDLSPAEHRVMRAICQGLSSADIAAAFQRSKNTIRNQTRRVYEVIGVRTRSALVSKCAALGLLNDVVQPDVASRSR